MAESLPLEQTTLKEKLSDSLEAGLAAAFGGPAAPVRAGAKQDRPQVAGYQVREKLGQGSYGEVWLACETKTGIEVAIKFFAHGTGLEWQLLQAEVKQLALLQAEPGIVQLKDVEPAASPPYYVMTYAENGCLGKRLAQGPFPLYQALPIFQQVTATLAYVHAKGIRHCDLKPANILLDARGRALVADFGQAHLSNDTSPALGTFFFMAPEQSDLDKQIPDTRWDVYGLGALLYAMLIGKPPREDPTIRSELSGMPDLAKRLERYKTLVKQAAPLTAHRQVPGMDRRLAEIIEGCLEIDPARRLRDAGAVLEALARRERHRRQRPIRLFALVAPLLLLMIMVCIVARIISPFQEPIQKAQMDMANQVHQRNEYLARILATNVREQLETRMQLLEEMAEEETLVPALQGGRKTELEDILEKSQGKWRKDGKEEGLAEAKSLFTYLWVTDYQGAIRAIFPRVKVPHPNYGFRDWFHGLGGDRAPGFVAPPVAKTYLGQPFVSSTKDNSLRIAVSTPIHDAAGKKVVGLLTGSIELRTFHDWFHQLKLDHSFAVLLNQHGHYLFHPDTEKIKPREGFPPISLPQDTEIFQRLVVEKTFGTTANPFQDPVNAKFYQASYAADPVVGWSVIIQDEGKPRTELLLEELNRTLITAGLIALVIYAMVIPALWIWLRWMLRREELSQV